MIQLLTILGAIFAGYYCPKLPFSMALLNKFLNLAIIAILVIMGYQFGSTSANLLTELLIMFKVVAVFVGCLLLANFMLVSLVFRNISLKIPPRIKMRSSLYFKSSCKYLVYVIIGITLGYIINIKLHHIDYIISLILLVVLFIIGFQLKVQNIALKTILVNRNGMFLALTVVVSSIIGGIIAAIIAGLPVKYGVMISSGFGWYTLSGILNSQLINQHMGTTAFFIDFIRELLALILIPLLGRKYPIQTVGYAGATALDFTLPVIKETLGAEVVPLAITSGMLLSILVPLLIPIVWQL